MTNIRIIPKEQQGQGAFNGGEIVENKPIGFPREGSLVRPYSNLFYWAHARAVTDSTIGLHPHQGFEICSFILKGEIRHYDTKLQQWVPLQAGDVQIIRAGNGISHSEFMAKDAEIFQIWFDPDLNKTLGQPATYDDYRADAFPVAQLDKGTVTTLVGGDSPFRMETPGVQVQRIRLDAGTYTFDADPDNIYSAYLLEGEALINGETSGNSDFILVESSGQVSIQTDAGADIFIIASPDRPVYRTYGGR